MNLKISLTQSVISELKKAHYDGWKSQTKLTLKRATLVGVAHES